MLYLSALPRSTGGIDEATYLSEALRVLRGDVIYRDFFSPTTPGWMYFMASVFQLFGATFNVARIAAAMIQGATAAAVFATCREVGVRREIAVAAAMMCVLSAQLNYPIASQHWMATLLATLALLIYLRHGRTTRGVFLTGLVVGLLIAFHQQRGLCIGIGVASFLTFDALVAGPRGMPGAQRLFRRATALAAGAAAIVGPMMVWLLWQAGFESVWRALVIFPLVDYRANVRVAWASERAPGYLPTEILKVLPLGLLLTGARAALYWSTDSGRPHRRHMMLIGLHSLASILSIWYLPDRIHISFIVPAFAVMLAEHAEWLLRRLPWRAQQSAGALIAASLLVWSGLWFHTERISQWARYRYAYVGPFGRVDLPNLETVALFTKVAELLHDMPSRTLYCQALSAHTCLFVGGHNPTRFELLVHRYNSPAHIQEAIAALQAKDVPYIVAIPAAVRDDDPLGAFIRRDYAQLGDGGAVGRYIWRRKQAAPRPAP